MDTPKLLIDDIRNFSNKAVEIQNQYGKIEKTEYFDLMERIHILSVDDFESEDKYNFFLQFFNQNQRSADRDVVKNSLRNGEYLDVGPFLFMCNDLNGIANWLE